MYSSSSCMRAEISVAGRCQFSSENANSVSTSTPASMAPSTTSRTAFIPARCPRGRGRLRSRAQRPLPSMIMATCRGTAPLRRICASRSSAISDFHDLRFLGLHRLIHLSQVVVVQLLDVFFRVLLLVIGDVLGLLDPADRLGARVPHGHAAFLGRLVHDLHQLAAPLFGEGGQRDADDVAVVRWGETQIGREDRFFDRLEQPLVPGLDGQELRLGGGHARDLGKRHLASVRFDAHEIEERRGRLSRAHPGELPPHPPWVSGLPPPYPSTRTRSSSDVVALPVPPVANSRRTASTALSIDCFACLTWSARVLIGRWCRRARRPGPWPWRRAG